MSDELILKVKVTDIECITSVNLGEVSVEITQHSVGIHYISKLKRKPGNSLPSYN